MPAMLTHAQVWNALDRLAARAKLSPSGLAKKSGLDPTTFNKSKRITPDGRPRWPSTESVAKALQATGASIDTFVSIERADEPGSPYAAGGATLVWVSTKEGRPVPLPAPIKALAGQAPALPGAEAPPALPAA